MIPLRGKERYFTAQLKFEDDHDENTILIDKEWLLTRFESFRGFKELFVDERDKIQQENELANYENIMVVNYYYPQYIKDTESGASCLNFLNRENDDYEISHIDLKEFEWWMYPMYLRPYLILLSFVPVAINYEGLEYLDKDTGCP